MPLSSCLLVINNACPAATYCLGRMAESLKSKSTGGFYHLDGSPCITYFITWGATSTDWLPNLIMTKLQVYQCWSNCRATWISTFSDFDGDVRWTGGHSVSGIDRRTERQAERQQTGIASRPVVIGRMGPRQGDQYQSRRDCRAQQTFSVPLGNHNHHW